MPSQGTVAPGLQDPGQGQVGGVLLLGQAGPTPGVAQGLRRDLYAAGAQTVWFLQQDLAFPHQGWAEGAPPLLESFLVSS